MAFFAVKSLQVYPKKLKDIIDSCQTQAGFEQEAIDLFRYQYQHNEVYREYCLSLGYKSADKIKNSSELPFLPISFFKKARVSSVGDIQPKKIFESSGTTGSVSSKHYLYLEELYQESLLHCFAKAFDAASDWCFFALLPGYAERNNASLVYMVHSLMERSDQSYGGFYLRQYHQLKQEIEKALSAKKKVMLFAVTHALFDFQEKLGKQNWEGLFLMETGGMKGLRKEVVRPELHEILTAQFNCKVYSEYGMTELLSQAYFNPETQRFYPPEHMKVMIRDVHDPLSCKPEGSGSLNIIDLANMDSCAFIATEDLGRVFKDGSFEVLGRMDHSEQRGCNLLFA